MMLCMRLFTGVWMFFVSVYPSIALLLFYMYFTIQALRDEDNIYIVTPFYGGGEVFDVVADRGQLEESEARPLFRQVLNGLLYLKARGVCHR